MNINDFKRVPKSHPKYNQRQYINSKTGQVISRWQYQTLKSDGINPKQRAADRRSFAVKTKQSVAQNRINNIVKKFKQKKSEELGTTASKIKVRGQSEMAVEFRRDLAKLNKLNARDTKRREKNKNYKRDYSPDGELAQLLVKLGLRDKDWTMPVGESPREGS